MRRFPVPVGLFAAVLIALVALVVVPAAGAWTWPSDGAVLQPYSFDPAHPYAAGQHRGIDVGGAAGAPVVAPAAGSVTFSGTVPGSGKTVTVTTPEGLAVTLTHLGSLSVAEGAAVAEGDGVGTIGPSGEPEVQEPYLHLGIRVEANAQGYLDPLSLLPARPAPVAAPSAPTAPPGPTAPSPAAVLTAPVSASPATVPAAPAAATPVPAPAEAAPAGPTALPVRAAAARGGGAPAASFLIVRHGPRVNVADVAASGSIARRAAGSGAPSRAGSSRAAAPRLLPAPPRAAGAPRGTVVTRRISEARPQATPRQRPAPVAGGREARERSRAAAHPRAQRPHVSAAAQPGRVRGAAPARVGFAPVPPFLALLAVIGVLVAAGVGGACLRGGRERVRMMARSGSGSEDQDPGSARLAVCGGASSPWPRGGLRRPVGRFRALSPPQGQRRSHGQRDGRARDAGDGRRRSRGEAIR